jgi:hypothetical protein
MLETLIGIAVERGLKDMSVRIPKTAKRWYNDEFRSGPIGMFDRAHSLIALSGPDWDNIPTVGELLEELAQECRP